MAAPAASSASAARSTGTSDPVHRTPPTLTPPTLMPKPRGAVTRTSTLYGNGASPAHSHPPSSRAERSDPGPLASALAALDRRVRSRPPAMTAEGSTLPTGGFRFPVHALKRAPLAPYRPSAHTPPNLTPPIRTPPDTPHSTEP